MRLRNQINKTLIGILLFSAIACSDDDQEVLTGQSATVQLYQILSDTDSTYLVTSESRGTIVLTQVDSIVTMFISLEGFAPNTIHAVHMHHGSCEQPKHHWNAGSEENFCNRRSLNVPWAKPYAGDVGNVSVGYDGTGSLTIKTNLWSIGSNDEKDILGLQVIVHEGYEDFTSECDPNHDHIHENDKLACGTIL